MQARVIGKIKSYYKDKGFGFIVQDTLNADRFFHMDDCTFTPQIGCSVSFELGTDRNGRLKACKISCDNGGKDENKT